MSKQQVREVDIRRLDLRIRQSFEIALAQLGVRFITSPMPYCKIVGNKQGGNILTVRTVNNLAQVYLEGPKSEAGGDVFFYVEKITFLVLDGKHLEEPRTVQMHYPHGESLESIMNHSLAHRGPVIYKLIGDLLGYELADSALYFLWEYPNIEIVSKREFHATYILKGFGGVGQVEIWYSTLTGYYKAKLDNRTFTKQPYKDNWVEVK